MRRFVLIVMLAFMAAAPALAGDPDFALVNALEVMDEVAEALEEELPRAEAKARIAELEAQAGLKDTTEDQRVRR